MTDSHQIVAYIEHTAVAWTMLATFDFSKAYEYYPYLRDFCISSQSVIAKFQSDKSSLADQYAIEVFYMGLNSCCLSCHKGSLVPRNSLCPVPFASLLFRQKARSRTFCKIAVKVGLVNLSFVCFCIQAYSISLMEITWSWLLLCSDPETCAMEHAGCDKYLKCHQRHSGLSFSSAQG